VFKPQRLRKITLSFVNSRREIQLLKPVGSAVAPIASLRYEKAFATRSPKRIRTAESLLNFF